jgi:hypothetical protein
MLLAAFALQGWLWGLLLIWHPLRELYRPGPDGAGPGGCAVRTGTGYRSRLVCCSVIKALPALSRRPASGGLPPREICGDSPANVAVFMPVQSMCKRVTANAMNYRRFQGQRTTV